MTHRQGVVMHFHIGSAIATAASIYAIKNATDTVIPSFHRVRRQCSHRRRSSASHWCSILYATETKRTCIAYRRRRVYFG